MKIRTLIKAGTFAAVIGKTLHLALTKSEEKKGDFSREFPEIQEELKQVIKDCGGKINE